MTCQTSKGSACSYPQTKVDQRPAWDNQVVSRRSKIIRCDKRKKKRKYL